MPFLKLDNSWSNLAKYYNQSFNNKPEVPTLKYTAFDDGLIRGGVINATLASVRDTARIGKFFASGKGVLFIAKQVGLQLSNPLLEQAPPEDTFGKLGTNTKSNLLNNAAGAANTAINAINSFINKRSPNQIYNLGLNTLTQIPLVSAGGHIIRHGITPIGGGGYLNGSTDNIKGYNYEAIARENNIKSTTYINSNTSIESQPYSGPAATTNILGQGETGKVISNQGGRLVTQYSSRKELKANLGEKSKTIGFSEENSKILENATITAKSDTLTRYLASSNRLLRYYGTIIKKGKEGGSIELDSYNGGPESAYGIGKTFIRTYTDQQTDITKKISDVSGKNVSIPIPGMTGTVIPFTFPKDSTENLLNGFQARPYNNIANRKAKIDRFNATYITPADKNNVEDRVGVSKVNKENNVTQRSVDAINTISIMNSKTFYGTSTSAQAFNTDNSTLFTYSDNTNGKVQAGYFGRDLIKFRIEFLNNNISTTSIQDESGKSKIITNTDVLTFRAYIDDFQDGMQAKWSSYRYMGRGEEFYIYDGFSRDMSIAFTMHAHSPEEMKPLYQKLNYLMSAFTPDYNSANKMRGNIGYLTVGDYVYRQPGIFTDIKLSGMLDTHWEIALNEPEKGSDNGQYEVPKHIKVNLTFKPIHSFLPRRVSTGDINSGNIPFVRAPFITRDDANNKYLKA